MSGDVTGSALEARAPCSASELAAAIARADVAGAVATVVGIGTMGKHFVSALRALGVKRVRLCARSPGPLESFRAFEGFETFAGGIERFVGRPAPGELAIIATPTALLIPAARRLASLGFRRLLIEKPVSLWPAEIERLAEELEGEGVEASCAYNRVAYPSCQEVRARVAREGGATSCTYTFTERIKPDWPQTFSAEELARWGIANSLHVMSMAHGVIGWPASWSAHRSGSLPWHPTGAVFMGSGVSDRGIPFGYHADWGSTGRWSVEVHTAAASYRLCPLEQVFRRTSTTSGWTDIPVAAFAPQVKAGITEQVAAMLCEEIGERVPLVSLRAAASLSRYAEAVFGYDSAETEAP
ncbi:MAG: Gfo/Idh/MocA family oxidoreductase [Candidatus Omnitrophica bacterium]|nr:Gfo/Idh/MocA family oxidoreductase [Candidatus Omnitrophota bacterium]